MSETLPMEPETSRGSIAKWMAAALLLMAAATFLSAHASNRVKLLGLFALAFSAGAAWGLSRLAIVMHVRSRISVISCTTVMVFAGLVGQIVIAHQQFAANLRQQFATNPTEMILKTDGKGSKTANQEVLDVIKESRQEREQRLQELSSFQSFLQHRIRALGWPLPFGLVIFIMELVLGTALATWSSSRVYSRSN